jgi:hypothetical protein
VAGRGLTTRGRSNTGGRNLGRGTSPPNAQRNWLSQLALAGLPWKLNLLTAE